MHFSKQSSEQRNFFRKERDMKNLNDENSSL